MRLHKDNRWNCLNVLIPRLNWVFWLVDKCFYGLFSAFCKKKTSWQLPRIINQRKQYSINSVSLSLKSLSFVAVVRMRIRWIRKILASWIRIRINMRIQGSESKRQKIDQNKLLCGYPFSMQPVSETVFLKSNIFPTYFPGIKGGTIWHFLIKMFRSFQHVS